METLSKKLHPFNYWNVDFTDTIDNESIATCPFCEHDDTRTGKGHFYVNSKTGAFICHSCGKQGSFRDFLRFIYQKALEETTETQLKKFTKDRGIPLPILKKLKFAYKDGKYFLPVYNAKEEIINLRLIRPGRKEHSTAGCDPGLVGIPELLKDTLKRETVYICEGITTKASLNWLLWRTENYGIVLSAPGANTFRDEWGDYFTGRNVVICYDNDVAGYGNFDPGTNKVSGSRKVTALIQHYAKSVRYVVWPERLKQGYDVRDFILDWKKEPYEGWKEFQTYIKDQHKDDLPSVQDNTVRPSIFSDKKPDGNEVKLSELIEKCEEHYETDQDFLDAVKIALATTISVRLPGPNNVWIFLVGPPASGKSLIIKLLHKCIAHVIWESRLSKKGLVSGFNLNNTGADPSIFARINNKCLVLKDLTECLTLPEVERADIFSLLRGSYDGSVKIPFGTGTRQYLTNYSMLAGVTHSIKMFNTAGWGERFLHYNLLSKDLNLEAAQEKALDQQLKGDKDTTDLTDLVSIFLNKTFDVAPESLVAMIPRWFRDRVKPLGRLVALLRTPVERHERGIRSGRVAYDPVPDTGNRVTTQLEKLALSLALIENKPQIDEDTFRIIKKVALDTVEGYNTNIVKLLMREGALSKNDIGVRTGIKFVNDYTDDLEILKVIERNGNEPLPNYKPTKLIYDLWKRSKI